MKLKSANSASDTRASKQELRRQFIESLDANEKTANP